MANRRYQTGPISDIEQFVLVGNSSRKGLQKAADELAQFINEETGLPAYNVESGRNVEESIERLIERDVDDIPSAIVVLGGDGTINHTLEATRNIENPLVYSIITDYFGGARDISYNIRKKTPKKYPQLLEYNLSSLVEASIFPIEVTINEQRLLSAYNVISIGRTALMAEQINKIRPKLHGPRPYKIAREAISIIDAKLLSTVPFKAREHSDPAQAFQNLQDLIFTKSERFGVVFKSHNDILEREFGVFEMDDLDFRDYASILLQRRFFPNLVARGDQTIKYTLVGQNLRIQHDGEVSLLEEENVLDFKNADKPAKILISE